MNDFDTEAMMYSHHGEPQTKESNMEEALKELVSHYHADRVSPGLQISWLQERNKFYVAVHRFPTNVESRTIVAKALAETCDMAMEMAMANWRKIMEDSK